MKAIRVAHLVLGAWTLVQVAPTAYAQCGTFNEANGVLAEDTVANDEFGAALAMDGDRALVGLGRGSSGADGAYFLRRTSTGWLQEARLNSTVPDACTFGHAVALDGNVGAVGDWAREPGGFCKGTGAVSIYRHNGATWALEQNLIGPNGVLSLGFSLALRGNLLLSGAPGQNPPVQRPPAVLDYRFDGNLWSLRQTFAAADSTFGDGFGEAIALSEDGTTLVVGAPYIHVAGVPDAGAAYVFRHDGSAWIEEQKLTPGDPELLANFGQSVAIGDDVVLIGSPFDDAQFVDAGSVYVFRYDGTQWAQTQNFAAIPQQQNGRYGSSLALDGTGLAVGEPLGERAHLLREVAGRFVPVQSLALSNPGPFDTFGSTVARSDERVLVGAPFANLAGSSSGAVYEFEAHELGLSHSPSTVFAGQTVMFTTCGGLPGTRCVLTLVGPNTSLSLPRPTLGILPPIVSFFDESKATVSFTIPPGAAGRTLRFQAFGRLAPGMPGASNVLRVDVN